MNCQDCKYWNGTKLSEWGACNCIMVHLFPEIRMLPSPFEHKRADAPFDPHDFYTYYYRNNALLRKIRKAELPDGVINVGGKKKSLTFIYNKDGEIIGERVSKVYIPLFYTYHKYACPLLQV